METLSNLIRLSYWSRIHSVVPAGFHELLPPAPEMQPIPGPPEAPTAQEGSDGQAEVPTDERDAATKRAFEMLTMVQVLVKILFFISLEPWRASCLLCHLAKLIQCCAALSLPACGAG